MKITRTREYTIERERTLTIRFNVAPVLKFCAECQAEMSFINVVQAAIIAQTTDRQIFRLVEANRLHCAESANGFLLVCHTSLQAAGVTVNPNQIETGENL